MQCSTCGASMTPEMISAEACAFCGTAVPQNESRKLAQAVEKLAAQPRVNVTRVEFRAPDLEVGSMVGSAVDGVTSRLFGCLISFVTLAFTVGIMLVVGGSIVWQVMRTTPGGSLSPSPSPSPSPPSAPRHGHR
jgi:hypothetical protein